MYRYPLASYITHLLTIESINYRFIDITNTTPNEIRACRSILPTPVLVKYQWSSYHRTP